MKPVTIQDLKGSCLAVNRFRKEWLAHLGFPSMPTHAGTTFEIQCGQGMLTDFHDRAVAAESAVHDRTWGRHEAG